MEFKIEPSAPHFVATVSNIDLRAPLGGDEVQSIERALDRYAVLVFHDQPLSQAELVAFGQSFGPLDTGLQRKLLQRVQSRMSNDAVSDISNLDSTGKVADRAHKQSLMNVGNMFWHSDSSYEHRPFRYSVLSAVSAVSWGGHTQFADLRAAYDALDERTQAFVADKAAVFYSHHTRQGLGIEDGEAELATYPPVRWPMVRTHPGSGRKLLWVDSKVCEVSGMSVPEGRALVHELIEHIGQREHVYSHAWKPGDLIMYDNRSVLHRGRRFDLTEPREMRRVGIADDAESLGEVPLARVRSRAHADEEVH